MEAIVLAGGLGTRLKSVVSNVPKPMAPIEDKPFLEYILKYLKKSGITRVILSVGYKSEIIEEYFGNNFEGIDLVYSVEKEPLGTGGAIKKAMSKVKSNQVYIINGDTFFDVNLKSLILEDNSKIILSLKHMKNFDRYGCVESDVNNLVTAFTEKGYRESGNINGGIYLARKEIFNNYDLKEKFSFEEFMQTNFAILNISVKVFDNYFIDIGIPEDYAKAQSEINEHI
ncbi:nucleotidyltransferase family protein [Aliarcobacter butzleri]|uniref:D-glycero-D-manno-heptose 1-phosphate guanosyltransferase n=1 Tax=Aliarcobacter butzleri TaxID=28197 RepID=UPI0021B2E3A8|nr:nucleotidyltransferase family protein [Aliarcobacter butzleri]MCT7604564.1 nucleotidyltransferase family protein [Aliarcobacter butzleri]